MSIAIRIAFDSFSWPFLFWVLERFGPKFVASLHSLYSSPMAQIVMKGQRSDSISHLFEHSPEMPSVAPPPPPVHYSHVKPSNGYLHPDMQGKESGGRRHKCALFSDILLSVTSPHTTLLSLLDRFGKISGLLVNQGNSEAMTVNLPILQSL